MLYLILSFISLSFAATDSQDAFEKSYPRDNTFCAFKSKRIELLIRGGTKYTDQNEKGFGDLIFMRQNAKAPILLPLSESHSDTFSFFKGVSPLCSKSLGFEIDNNTVAILFLKENRPFKNKLVIQLFDKLTMFPTNYLDTNFLADKAVKSDRGFSFRTYAELYELDGGKTTIKGENYLYHEQYFPQWMDYDSQGFTLKEELTFKKFPHKKYFKDQEDFFTQAGWNPGEKKFSKTVFYAASDKTQKKVCFLFLDKKEKITGLEDWRCHIK